VAAGRPVFVDFTAAWCITCLVNERIALETPTTRHAFEQAGVVKLKGDWTNRDAEITSLLRSWAAPAFRSIFSGRPAPSGRRSCRRCSLRP